MYRPVSGALTKSKSKSTAETKETCNEKKNKIETNRKCEILKFSHFKK